MEEIARRCVELARQKGLTLAVAESCTGGMLGAALSAVPGASQVFQGGVIAYANSLKREVLGVEQALLDAHGAVSEPVACAMAAGVRRLTGADWAVSVTGIAGPTGESPDKPLGLVHIAVCGPERLVRHQQHQFGNIGRDCVRRQSAQAAIELIDTLMQSL